MCDDDMLYMYIYGPPPTITDHIYIYCVSRVGSSPTRGSLVISWASHSGCQLRSCLCMLTSLTTPLMMQKLLAICAARVTTAGASTR